MCVFSITIIYAKDIINHKYSPFILISQYIFYYSVLQSNFLFYMSFVGPSTSQSKDPTTTTGTTQTSNIVRLHVPVN